MPIISTFCRKGGVGKTTWIAIMSHYFANQGKNVLIVSVDDQNSIFKSFGKEHLVTERNDDYFEFYINGDIELVDIPRKVRDNLYVVKTRDTNRLATTILFDAARQSTETADKVIEAMNLFNDSFDYVFLDFPPIGNILSDILISISDDVLIVVGLDSLGIDGFFNTIQYFMDNDLPMEKITYILPNMYDVRKRAPQESLKTLHQQVKDFKVYNLNAKVLPPFKDKSIVRNLQAEGDSVFDPGLEEKLKPYDLKMYRELLDDLKPILDEIDFK